MGGGGGMEEVTHKPPARVDRPSPTTGGNSPVPNHRPGRARAIDLTRAGVAGAADTSSSRRPPLQSLAARRHTRHGRSFWRPDYGPDE